MFQFDKVKTPTHVVAGGSDDRVAVAEDYLLEHALHTLGIPSSLLVFPDEGHSLDQEPLARQNQSARRTQVAGEILRLPGEVKGSFRRKRWLSGQRYVAYIANWL